MTIKAGIMKSKRTQGNEEEEVEREFMGGLLKEMVGEEIEVVYWQLLC